MLDGAAPELEQLIMAAGTISFFGTRRVVVLPELDPAAYSDKDLDALCETLSSLENAVVVLGSVFPLEPPTHNWLVPYHARQELVPILAMQE